MPAELERILDKDEAILWQSAPLYRPFVLGRFLPSLFTLIFFFGGLVFAIADPASLIFLIFFMAFGLGIPPLVWWHSRAVFPHTYYAITNRRLIIQQGVVARDFVSIALDQIIDVKVDVGIIDNWCKEDTGTVTVGTAGTASDRWRAGLPHAITGIPDPYAVFRLLKQQTLEMRADNAYPNASRPAANPGYRSPRR